jgi:hypothetical protein
MRAARQAWPAEKSVVSCRLFIIRQREDFADSHDVFKKDQTKSWNYSTPSRPLVFGVRNST